MWCKIINEQRAGVIFQSLGWHRIHVNLNPRYLFLQSEGGGFHFLTSFILLAIPTQVYLKKNIITVKLTQ
jgi:hypothetical protein